jgi:hypothetical protein
MSWNSSVGIATRYGFDDLSSIHGRGKRFFFPPQRPDRLWSSPSFISNGYREAFSLRIKQPGLEADHSPLSNAEVKNRGKKTEIKRKELEERKCEMVEERNEEIRDRKEYKRRG